MEIAVIPHRPRRRAAVIVAAVALLARLLPATALADAVIGTGTAASCETQQAANDLSTAVAAGGTITFNCGPAMVTIVANTNATDQTVVVNGGGKVTLSGDNLRQIFFVFGTGNVTLNDLILIDGDAGQGGAIYVDTQARVTLNRSFVTSNKASNEGAGIYNKGTLAITTSTLGSNIATGNGGGIYNSGGTVTLDDSYLVSNQAQHGGAIYTTGGQVTLQRSAVRSGFISGDGGGVYAAGPTTLTNVTFSNNRAAGSLPRPPPPCSTPPSTRNAPTWAARSIPRPPRTA